MFTISKYSLENVHKILTQIYYYYILHRILLKSKQIIFLQTYFNVLLNYRFEHYELIQYF